jgi:hypothetical protein
MYYYVKEKRREEKQKGCRWREKKGKDNNDPVAFLVM